MCIHTTKFARTRSCLLGIQISTGALHITSTYSCLCCLTMLIDADTAYLTHHLLTV